MNVGEAIVGSVSVVALGRTVRLLCASDDTADGLRRSWSRCLTTEQGGEAAPSILVDGQASHEVLEAVTSAAVQPHIGESLLLQGAAMCDSRGKAVVLLGHAGAGRTTAAERLGRHLGYVTDERVAIDARGHLSPFDRPLLRRNDSGEWATEALSPDELDLLRRPDDITIHRLVVLARDGTSPPVLETLDGCGSLLEVAAHAVFLDSLEWPLQRIQAAIRLAGGVFRLRYREIDEAREQLEGLIEEPLPAPTEGTVMEAFPSGAAMARWGLMDGRVRRAPYRDALLVDDDLVIFGRDAALQLSGIGTTVWLEATGLTLEELTARVVTIHGSHPNAAELVGEAVEELTLAGVVARFLPHRVDDRPSEVT